MDDDGYGNPGFPENICPLDNCVDTPNGPNLGTCYSWSAMESGTTICMGNNNCMSSNLCSLNQEDGDMDGLGDVCDNCLYDNNPGQEDDDEDGIGNLCDNCPNDVNTDQTDSDGDCTGDVCDGNPEVYDSGEPDSDSDGLGDICDNCQNDYNPDQLNSDFQDGGDICDVCPADNTDACDPSGSAADTVDETGGTVSTPDDSCTIDVPAGAVDDDTTFSITDTGSGYEVETDQGEAESVLGVQLESGDESFSQPVTVTLIWDDEDNDGLVEVGGEETSINEAALFITKDGEIMTTTCDGATCSCIIHCTTCSCDLNTNSFEVDVTSFSEFTLAVPLDSDGDGVTDNFDGVVDNCPYATNPEQEDFGDGDGVGDTCDNCPNIPNGPVLGLCAQTECGAYRYSLKECTNNPECVDHYDTCWTCLQNQEDIYPPGGNGTGDACEWCYANFDGDSNVYPSDLSIFLGEYGRTDCFTTPPPCETDIDGDGNVYPSDLSIFLEEYGREDCPVVP